MIATPDRFELGRSCTLDGSTIYTLLYDGELCIRVELPADIVFATDDYDIPNSNEHVLLTCSHRCAQAEVHEVVPVAMVGDPS